MANGPRYKQYNEKNDYDRTNNGFLSAKRIFKNLEIRISENDPELIQSSKYEVRFRRVVSYDPEVTNDEKRYRSYLIHSVSRLFVFLSTDDYALVSKSTGANEFELLPLQEKEVKNEKLPLILSEDDDVVTIRSSIGIVAQLSKETGEIVGIDGFKVEITPLDHIDKLKVAKGGIRVLPLEGHLVVDYGFNMGDSPTGSSYIYPTIIDSQGNKCIVQMAEVVELMDGKFKFTTNEEVRNFLKVRCPKILF